VLILVAQKEKMKKVCLFILVVLIASSCRQPKILIYQNVQNFGIRQAGLQQTTISMDVHLHNPNPYRMKLKDASLDLFINGIHTGFVHVPTGVRVPKLGDFSLPVALDVDLANVLPNLFQLFTNSMVDVKLTGKVKAGRYGVFINVPINYEGKQDVSKGIKW
jgi:LEA14-like dessication related protein